MREQTQCVKCHLVQFHTKRNACRRCRAPLPERRALPLEPPLPEISSEQPRRTAPLGIIPPLEETVRRAVLDAMDKCEGNVLLAAKCLQVGKTTLYRYLQEWGWTSPNRQAAALLEEAEHSAVQLKRFGTYGGE